MKLSELVPCWGPPAAAAVAVAPQEEGERASDSCSRGEPRSSAAWRPSLVAISEDGVPSAAAAAMGRPERRRSRPAKEPAARSRSQAAKTPARDDRDRFGGVSVPVAIPSFTPTAFLF